MHKVIRMELSLNEKSFTKNGINGIWIRQSPDYKGNASKVRHPPFLNFSYVIKEMRSGITQKIKVSFRIQTYAND